MHSMRLIGMNLASFFPESYSNVSGGGAITPGSHTLVIVRKSLALGHVGYCSCGEWKVVGGKNEFPTDAASDLAMQSRHQVHVDRVD